MSRNPFEPAVEVTRGRLVESVHAAAIAVVDASGRLIGSLGDPDRLIYLRSAAKPFQATAVLASGVGEALGLTPAEIAIAAGSHGGDDHHAETASLLLARAGLGESHLGCGTHTPFSRDVADRLLRTGEKPTPRRNNCSGKHAAMLAAAQHGGHPLADYLDPRHPVQQANLQAVAAFTGRAPERIAVGVDGCSAPTFGVSLGEAARAFARLAATLNGGGPDGPYAEHAARVAQAMRAHPEMVAGEGMLDTALMRSVPGLIAKVGADGVHAMGWLSERGPVGIAVKVMDGDVGRGRTAVVLEVLRLLGALPDLSVLPPSVTAGLKVRSLRGIPAGEVRTVFGLTLAW